MEQSTSWEDNCRSTSEEIPRTLWNQRLKYHVHKIQPLDPILIQMTLVHTLTPCFFMNIFKIILASTPNSSKWLPPSKFDI